MKIFVKVNPGSKKEKIEKIDKSHFVVSVKELPVRGRANRAVIKVVACYFKVPQSNIRIISGLFSRQKIIKIPEDNF